jgi:AraC-like DNA-binding protein
MLRSPDARVLDVTVACGFKTQQHFAQVFRDVCGIRATNTLTHLGLVRLRAAHFVAMRRCARFGGVANVAY